MRCSVAREALSAWLDGEVHPAPRREVHAHLAGCPGCAAFEESLVRLPTTPDRPVFSPPDLTDAILAAAGIDPAPSSRTPPRSRLAARLGLSPAAWLLVLRWGVALMAVAELGMIGIEFASHLGTLDADHASHESLSFTVAVCVGLFCTAVRPSLSRGCLPVVGVAVLLLTISAGIDLTLGRTAFWEEAPHLDLVVALGMLWLLSRTPPADASGPPARPPTGPAPGRPGAPRLPRRPGLRLVTRTGPPGLALVRSATRGAGGVVATLIATLTAGLATLVLVAAPAGAHAVLESSTPAPDAVLAQLPDAVTLQFSEPVSVLPTSVRVYGPDGARVDAGAVTNVAGDPSRAQVALESDQPGTYLVSWRVVSADSHPIAGSYTFSLQRTSTAPVAPADSTDPSVAALLGVARWVGYLAVAVLIGGAVFLRVCWPRGWTQPWAVRLLRGAAVTGGLATVALLVVKGPYDAARGLTALADPHLLGEVLTTTYGHATLARVVLLLAAAGLLFARRRWDPAAAPATVLALVLAVAIAVTFAFAGHAVSGDPRGVALLSDVVHVLAMSLWVGGLVMLLTMLERTRRAASRTDTAVDAAAAVQGYSRIAAWSVLALVASGTYQAWDRVGSWPALTGTTYGRELLVKLGLVAVVLAAAAFSRAWVIRERHPPLHVLAATTADLGGAPPQPGGLTASGDRPTLARLRRSVLLEAAGMVAVLGVTAALVATEPASSAYRPTLTATLTLGPDTVRVSAVPAGDRRATLLLHVLGPDQQPTDPAELTAALSLPDREIAALPVDLSHPRPGRWQGTLAVPIAGDWRVDVVLRTTEVDQFTGAVTVAIR